ncbi:aspartyl/asparaginyl beta-hydroxylase domain-containing protein [Pseudoalteromonas sp. C2R02]|uniref:aspartyl/asparaginyl beta-hydroxylase domain-containing protein n=1 Tax=Pseudoalteromonas sp. C2R02 TaxID=2841565 RepID=UPI001C09B827|nr:aspartyl/asparaginyl beta-hydroxylase domain-containing protein [Pseudoalteromonas sp. C2R02]MBU2970398.1 aspartyl/asparaginyl beta-hydroxylase domain-containing protein [Pseudoalteromonas sp. C2R02]
MTSIFTFFVFFLFPLCSVIYVYRFRGQARFTSFVEYLRKGWPIFAPLNVFLYICTKRFSQKAFVKTEKFNKLNILEDNWQKIAQEAQGLHDKGFFEQTTSKENSSFYDVGFRTFYKYGWSKFYCTWYGTHLNSAMAHCPKTVELLNQIPSVNGAMFTLLPAKSKLTRHLDPVACSFRYHLGLNTPNSEDCFINVDSTKQSWKDGEAFIFDETCLHYVENNSQDMRLILMCDIERPMNIFGKLFNKIYKFLISQMLVPNLPGDQAGIVNKLFAKVTPFLTASKAFKKQNPKLYYPFKWCFNLILLCVFVGILILLSNVLFSIILID